MPQIQRLTRTTRVSSRRRYRQLYCPSCYRKFQRSSSVLKHLNHPSSSCAPWFMQMEEYILTRHPKATEYRSRLRAALGTSTLMSRWMSMNPTPACPSRLTTDPTTITSLAATLPQPGNGQGFQQWFNADEFAHEREENLYYPFASKAEWQLASFMMRSRMSMKDIDDFLELSLVWLQCCIPPRYSNSGQVRDCLPLSFKSAKELRSRIELLPKGPQWKSTTIKFDGFPTKKPLVLYYRDTLECIESLFKNPLFEGHLNMVPKQHFRNGRRLWKDWISSDSAWAMQAALPMGRALLGVIGTSDKTNISVMNGDRVAHPFLVSLANIDTDVMLKASNHSFMMAALMPVPKFLCPKEIRGLMERRLLHHCIDIVCAPLKAAAMDGHIMSTSSGQLVRAHTPLVAYIADAPEAADIACVKGQTSHLTTASYHTFGDPFRHPERTGDLTWNNILSVNSAVDPWDVAKYQKASKELRLSGVHLPFWRDWSLSTNPSRFLTMEPLHTLHKGFFDHDFQWGRKIVGDEEIDFRLSIIQPRIGFRHFKEGVTQLKQLGGREHRELERCFIAVIADAAPAPVIRALRALIDFRFLAQAPEMDQVTLTRLTDSLAEFHQYKQHIIDAGGREQDHFKIPKLEFMQSVVSGICWAGVPMQFTADVTEKAHSTEIKVPARTQTNHRDYDPQIARYLDRAEKMRLFDIATGLGEKENGAVEVDDDDSAYDEVAAVAGESSRPVRNLFRLAIAHSLQYPNLERRIFTTESTAFSLNRTPNLPCISVDDAAVLFDLPDLRPALGDYLKRSNSNHSGMPAVSIIGGARRSTPECPLPFSHLQVWYNVRVQNKSPHSKPRPIPAQNLQAQPPNAEWVHGRYDTVLLCNDKSSAWPGRGFREGLHGHTIAQIRLIMRPICEKSAQTPPLPYIIYAQRYDIVPQNGSPTGRDLSSGMYILKRSIRTNGSRLGDIVELDNIRIPVELVARFGKKADPRFTAFNSLECSTEVRLNKYSTKELFWILESVSL
ncbi:hypothetical protein R3P38DRAFT_3317338 [Favolaschia claudopus]|uniref:DUF6830 domain-containing protein n=1 Tax=Favolaschia claudopus TaxID=2862362 RepID=A0AAW0BBQ3_9AGAR